MKRARTWLFPAVLFLFTALPFAASASVEEGFRGIPWGANLSGHPDMRRITCEDASCTYVRSGEDLRLGEALVSSITYRACEGRFVEATIEAPAETRDGQAPGAGSENFLVFRQACQNLFGPTTFEASFEYLHADQYRWEATDIRKVLRVNFNKNHLSLSITDHGLLKRLEKNGARGADPAARQVLSEEPSKRGAAADGDQTAAETGRSDRADHGEKGSRPGKIGSFLKRILVSGEPPADMPEGLPGRNTP